MARSNKPIIWGLFAAGGTLSAFVVPALVFVTGPGILLGFFSREALAYERILGLAGNPLFAIILFLVISIILWHSAHRLRITAHDLGVAGDGVVKWACYGVAALGTLAAAVLLVGF